MNEYKIHDIQEWVQDNLDLLHELLVELNEQKEQMLHDEPEALHADVVSDYRKGVEFIVSREIQHNLQVTPEDVIIFFEGYDILEILEDANE